MGLTPRSECFLVDRHQRRHEGLAVADHHALADQAVRPDSVLEHRRSDVLAARGHQDLLLPPGDAHEAVVVDLPYITCMEPAVVVDDLGGRGLVVPVAGKDLSALEQELSVVGDSHRRTGQRPSHRPDPFRARDVHGQGGSGLGQAVPLHHRQPDTSEEVGKALSQRRPSGDRVPGLPSERCPQLAVDESVEEGVAPLEQLAGAAAVLRLAVRDRGGNSSVEDLAPTVGGGALTGGVEHLLENPWHSQDEGRLEGAEVVQQVLDVGRVSQPYPHLHRADLDDAREDMCEWKEEQRAGPVGVEQVVEDQGRDTELEHEVAVREHAGFRPSGCPGGVDERGQGVRRHRGSSRLEIVVAHLAAGGHELVESALVEADDLTQLYQLPARLLDRADVISSLGHRENCRGVREDPRDLLLRGRLVERDGDRTGVPDRIVEQSPLVASLRHQSDAVPGGDAGRQQPPGSRPHLAQELVRGDVAPGLASPASHDDLVATMVGVRHYVVSQAAGRGNGVCCWSGELMQAHCYGPPLEAGLGEVTVAEP